MAHTLQTEISSPNTIIKIITDVPARNTSNVNDTSKELEKGDREHKESSSTQTSSSSSLLHKRKSHCYYASSAMYKPPHNYAYTLFNRPKRNPNTTSQKIITAKFLRVKQLQSELAEAQKRISDLADENRTLKNIQKRQDCALRKYESQESHLPQLMKSHEEELRVLTQKYKKLRNAYNELESRHNKQCTELMNMKDRHKHLLQISQDKHLLQREQLTKQIEEMKTVINDLKNKIKLQSRRLDLETKNFKYQLSAEINKQKSLQEQLKRLQDIIQKLQLEIKDKERCMANCKINQHMINKMNQLRLKMPSSNEKSVSRICSTYGQKELKKNGIFSDEENFNKNSFPKNNDRKESTAENSNDSDDDLVSKPNHINNEEKERKPYSFENSLPSINQNNFSDSKSNSSDTKSSFSSYFDLDYLQKSNFSNHVEIRDKSYSDDNNNFKRVSESQAKTEPDKTESVNNPSNLDPLVEHNEFQAPNSDHDDTDSQKSEDLKEMDETISWLEFHEKLNPSDNKEEKKSQKIVENSENKVTKKNNNSLPFDKKSALLSALREIDLENNENSSTKAVSSKKENKIDEKIIKNGKLATSMKTLKTFF